MLISRLIFPNISLPDKSRKSESKFLSAKTKRSNSSIPNITKSLPSIGSCTINLLPVCFAKSIKRSSEDIEIKLNLLLILYRLAENESRTKIPPLCGRILSFHYTSVAKNFKHLFDNVIMKNQDQFCNLTFVKLSPERR